MENIGYRTIQGYAETDYGIIRLVNKKGNVTNDADNIERRPSIIIVRGMACAFE